MDIYFETCPTLEKRLHTIREYSYVDLSKQISHLSLDDQLPLRYLAILDDDNRATCFRATLLCYCVTGGTQVPREMQLKAILADQHGDDSLIAADSRQRKKMTSTLVMEYERLLSMKVHLETTNGGWCGLRQCTQFLQQTNLYDSKRRVPGEARHLIVTVEQLIRSREGHFPRLNILLRDQCFQKLVLRFNVNRAHHVHTAGVPLYGLDAVRPVWGKLGRGGMMLNDKVYSGILCSKAVFERWALSASAINKRWIWLDFLEAFLIYPTFRIG